MKRLLFLFLPLLCLAAAPGDRPRASRFTYVDVMIDPKGQPLAAVRR